MFRDIERIYKMKIVCRTNVYTCHDSCENHV